MYYILMSSGGFASYDQISENIFEISVVSFPLATSFSTLEDAINELNWINNGGNGDETYKVNSPYLQSSFAECVVEIHYPN